MVFGHRINIRLPHRDFDLECNAKYHIERYLDKEGICLDTFEYLYEDIEDIVERCRDRSGDLEYGL